MFQEFQKVWVIYLITSYTVFTLPEPVFSQNNPTGPVYVRSSSNGTSSSTTGSSVEPTGRDGDAGILEPIALASSHVETELHETLIADASSHHGRGPPPRKHPPPFPARPPRRHPPPHPSPPHLKKPNVLIKKPINFNNQLHVPKILRDHNMHKHHKEHEQPPRHQNRERGHDSIEMRKQSPHKDKHHSNDKHARHSLEDNHHSHDKHTRHSHEDSHEHKHHHRKVSTASSESSGKGSGSSNSKRDRSNNEPNKSFIEDEFYRGGNSGDGPTGNSVQDERFYSDEKASREVQPTSIRSPDFPYKESEYPLPFPKPPKPVQLSYYYDSDDGKDLKDLIHNHHIRRKKDCDGLDNFVYDLEIISFFLGLIAAGIGLYADVIPFFNEGVKINYNNDLLNPGGDGIDFPHEYWPIKGPTKANIHKRTISIGTDEDNQREVLSVAGEFISGFGLFLSFIGLFPTLIEKFFYSLDWWFGKRGLWKQYLYTYKCEIHPYPQPGWGR